MAGRRYGGEHVVPQAGADAIAARLRRAFGFTGDESKSFTLEIALPVMQPQQNYVGKFALRQSTPFRCVEVVHEGPWDQIPATYGKLMNFMAEQQLMPTFEYRELYVNADFSNPQANAMKLSPAFSEAVCGSSACAIHKEAPSRAPMIRVTSRSNVLLMLKENYG